MQIRESTVPESPDRPPDSTVSPMGYAQQAIRLERTLGWVLWIGLAIVLVMMSV
jgi:hypothetical protein